jgi:hypothetical protein
VDRLPVDAEPSRQFCGASEVLDSGFCTHVDSVWHA